MNHSILIHNGSTPKMYVVNQIEERQIFQLAGYIQKTLHQSTSRVLIDEELVAFAQGELGVELTPVKIIAEINISKPLQDW